MHASHCSNYSMTDSTTSAKLTDFPCPIVYAVAAVHNVPVAESVWQVSARKSSTMRIYLLCFLVFFSPSSTIGFIQQQAHLDGRHYINEKGHVNP